MVSQKGFAPILVVLSIIVVMGLAGGAYYYNVFNENSQENTPSSPKISPLPTESSPPQASSTAVPSAEKEVVTITLPEGWKKKIINDENLKDYRIQITSPDYEQITSNSWPGLNIGIFKGNNAQTYEEKYKEIYDGINNPNPESATYKNLQKTTVAGYKALSYDYFFEGNVNYYELWDGDEVWMIEIASSDGAPQAKYKDEINSMLDSIKFF